jgi:hypothetical protein
MTLDGDGAREYPAPSFNEANCLILPSGACHLSELVVQISASSWTLQGPTPILSPTLHVPGRNHLLHSCTERRGVGICIRCFSTVVLRLGDTDFQLQSRSRPTHWWIYQPICELALVILQLVDMGRRPGWLANLVRPRDVPSSAFARESAKATQRDWGRPVAGAYREIGSKHCEDGPVELHQAVSTTLLGAYGKGGEQPPCEELILIFGSVFESLLAQCDSPGNSLPVLWSVSARLRPQPRLHAIPDWHDIHRNPSRHAHWHLKRSGMAP